jgi:phage terminase small subunit
MASKTTASSTESESQAVLNDRQILFCRHYARTLNATESYKLAGYDVVSDDTARSNASRLLANANVKAYLSQITEIDEVSIIGAVASIAFTPITDILQWDGAQLVVKQSEAWSARAKLAVKKFKFKQTFNKDGDLTSVDAEVEMHDRLSALEKLMRVYKLTGGDAVAETAASSATMPQVDENGESPSVRFFRELTGTDFVPRDADRPIPNEAPSTADPLEDFAEF